MMSRELAASLLESDREEMRHLGAVISELFDELHQVRAEYNELYAQWRAKNEACNQAYAVEIPALREALLEAMNIIDDWVDCPTKNQHTNTIQEIEELLYPGLPEGIARLTRESCKGGSCE